MRFSFDKTFLAIFMILLLTATARAENLGLYNFNLNMGFNETINTAINEGFRIKIYGTNLDATIANKLFQMSYLYEVANENRLVKQFENDNALYRVITNSGEIKYAKGFTVYNFLNGRGNIIGSFIFDDNLIFINKNKFDNFIIPVKLFSDGVTIDMIFHKNTDIPYSLLFFAVSFFHKDAVNYAINVLNKRFGTFVELKNDHISARYWQKDGTSVSNYFGLNDRFVFYNIQKIIDYNKQEKDIARQVKHQFSPLDKATLRKLCESM